MLRPGRLDKSLYIDLPNGDDRLSILTTLCRQSKFPLDPSVSLSKWAHCGQCDGFSGADLEGLRREAGAAAVKRRVLQKSQLSSTSYPSSLTSTSLPSFTPILVDDWCFEEAFKRVKASVSPEKRIYYQKLRRKYGVVVE